MASQGSKTVGHVKFNIADVPTLKLQGKELSFVQVMGIL